MSHIPLCHISRLPFSLQQYPRPSPSKCLFLPQGALELEMRDFSLLESEVEDKKILFVGSMVLSYHAYGLLFSSINIPYPVTNVTLSKLPSVRILIVPLGRSMFMGVGYHLWSCRFQVYRYLSLETLEVIFGSR